MIESWFPTLIFSEKLDKFSQNNLYLANKAQELKKQFNNQTSAVWFCDTFNTLNTYDWERDRDPILMELVDLCRQRVYSFSEVYGVKKPLSSLICKELWYNIASPGNFQEYHIHTISHFSVVYYVSSTENSGRIRFQNKVAAGDMFGLPVKSEDETFASFGTCFYPPTESMMLAFRSNLPHMVEKNMSDKDRISIAMNFVFI